MVRYRKEGKIVTFQVKVFDEEGEVGTWDVTDQREEWEMLGGAQKVRNVRWDVQSNEERDKQLPRYVTRARDVTGPVTRAPCAPGHVSCHALAPSLFPPTAAAALFNDCIPSSTGLSTVSLVIFYCTLVLLVRSQSLSTCRCCEFTLSSFLRFGSERSTVWDRRLNGYSGSAASWHEDTR